MRHLFWEEMKRLLYVMTEVELEDLYEETLDDILAAMNAIERPRQD